MMVIKVMFFLNRARGDSLVSTIGENSEFLQLDIDNVNSLQEALDGE